MKDPEKWSIQTWDKKDIPLLQDDIGVHIDSSLPLSGALATEYLSCGVSRTTTGSKAIGSDM